MGSIANLDPLTTITSDQQVISEAAADRIAIKADSGVNILVGDDDDSELTGGTGLDWCSDVAKAFSGCDNKY